MIVSIIAGAAGGFAKSLAEQKGRVALPKVEKAEDGTSYVHLGFLVNVVLGAAAGAFIPEPVGAFTSGAAAAFFGEKAVERSPVAKVV